MLSIFWLLAASLSVGLCYAQPIPAFTAEYTLNKAGFVIGKATVSLDWKGNAFTYQSVTEPKGILAWFRSDHITERSQGRYIQDKLIPDRYQYLHKGSRKHRDLNLEFNWEKRIVRNLIPDDHWTLNIPADTLDRITVQLAMMLDMQAKRSIKGYDVIDKGKLKQYRFNQLDSTRIETPAGEFDTLIVKRVRSDNKRETTLWCASKLAFLPVRVDYTESDGASFSMHLKKLTGF